MGQLIKEQRLSLGWSQTKLAQVTGLSRQLLSLVENGHGNCTLTTMNSLAQGLGLNFYVLLLPSPDHKVIAERIEQFLAQLHADQHKSAADEAAVKP